MIQPSNNRWLHRFAVLTALATLALIGIGGLVTSHEAGMSVPDWPNSYGYNMFLFPPSKWVGGILYEHTHRLWASMVGLLIVALTRWLGGKASRRPLAIVGALEVLAGIALLVLRPDLKATGGFLTGIGGIVLLAALVWVRGEAAPGRLPQLGWLAFALVQIQGLLGGLRVVLFKDQIGIFHATLAQLFFVLTCLIALMTSKWWNKTANTQHPTANTQHPIAYPGRLHWFILATTGLILFQLILGATMRHQHAGLSIRDFPLAYGKLWPATDPASVARYNEHRIEITNFNPITAFQIQLQMVHRIVAVLILGAVAFCAWIAWRKHFGPIAKISAFWLGLIFCQACLGAATVLTDKAADVATAHVLVGALSLATGAALSIIALRFPQRAADVSSAQSILESASSMDLKGTIGVRSADKMPAAH
ncbi:MAG TPA: COX15/CtaA family protein [Verrucomicrobiae bacterium]|nr:COX15/CtaA family protein [Verrucomicrobiae bacterium]